MANADNWDAHNPIKFVSALQGRPLYVSYGNGQTHIQHLPFAESAIERSVTALERESGPVPDFADGYREWRQAFDEGKGGVFAITVAEAFDGVTSIARNQK